MTYRHITMSNVITVWIGFVLAACRIESDSDLLPITFQWAFATAHGVLHLLFASFYGYHPGAAQSVLMVPLGLHFLHAVGKQHGTRTFLAAAIYGGPFAHVVATWLPLWLVREQVISDRTYALWTALCFCLVPLVV